MREHGMRGFVTAGAGIGAERELHHGPLRAPPGRCPGSQQRSR